MKNLDNLQLHELTIEEQTNIDGGRRIPWKAIYKFMKAVGLYDIASDFAEGWNSVKC